ncbi:MAG: YibE/F family protein [Acidimicrobiales bacterium]
MAHGHSHVPDDTDPSVLTSPRARAVVWGALALVAAVTVAGLVLLWPREQVSVGLDVGFGEELVDATVNRVELVPCSGAGDAPAVRCEQISARVTSGSPRGQTATFELFPSANSPQLDSGDQIVLSHSSQAPPELAYQFADFQRDTPLLWLGALFVLAVVALGRWKGVRALLGVGVSLVVIVTFLLPALLLGDPPVLLALVAASTIAYLALFLAHGLNERTAVALLGTLLALALTAGLAVLFVSLARITGLASEEVMLLQASSDIIDLRGLLLAGIMIGALGVLDDVTVTQVAAVWELKLADRRFGAWELYRRAINIGRDHIASVVNTLALAYAGAALPLLLLFTQAQRSFDEVVTGEAVAMEVVRTLVGSIGLVAAVPITTGIAALVIAGAVVPDDSSGRGRGRRDRGRRDPFWGDVDLDGS